MRDLDDFHAFKSTGFDEDWGSGGNGSGIGCGGWAVIVIVIILLIFLIADGAGWEEIDCLLGWGLLAFLFFRWLFG